MPERHARILAGLAEQGAALAADLQRRALAAADDAVAAALATAFHRVARSLRQTLALELKMVREHRLLANGREVEARARAYDQDHDQAVIRKAARSAELRAEGRRLIWTEYEGADTERLEERLDDWVERAMREPGFADEPFELAVARLRAELDAVQALRPPRSPAPAGSPPPASRPFHASG